MPSLIRFLVFIAIIAGIIYGSMIALTIFVEPREKEVEIRIPARKLDITTTGDE